MHADEHRPHVAGKTKEEIEEYYWANEKDVKGGTRYDSKTINFDEVYMYCHLMKEHPYGDFDEVMQVVAQEEKEGEIPFKWKKTRGKNIWTFEYKGFTCIKEVRAEWNGLIQWHYVVDGDGKLIGGIEKSPYSPRGEEGIKEMLERDELVNYYLLKALAQ